MSLATGSERASVVSETDPKMDDTSYAALMAERMPVIRSIRAELRDKDLVLVSAHVSERLDTIERIASRKI